MNRAAADAAYEQYRAVRFFGSLNGLRFLCIFMVMWHHSPAYGSLEAPHILLTRGFLGVDFFFVLSGFLITTLLLREESRNGRISLRGFYWRRILRIVPVYFLVVTAMSLYWVVYKGMDHLAPLIPYYYLFLSNMLIDDIPLLSITWSLAVEEQYYVIWPLLFLLLAPARRAFVLVGLIGLCVLSAAGLLSFLGIRPIATAHAVWGVPVSGYSAILIGTLAAVTLHAREGFVWLYRLCRSPAAPLVAFALLVAVLSLMPGRLTGFPNLLVHMTMALCLVTLVVREDHWLAPLLLFRPIARIGEISYGLYLYHLIARHFGVEFGKQLGLGAALEPFAITIIFMLMAIAMAEISFRTYERFFLTLKHTRPAGKSAPL